MSAPETGRDDAFLSYAREDLAFVTRLRDALTARGKKVWVDLEDILPSADWRAKVHAGIEETKAFVAVLSPDFVKSRECGEEVQYALELKKRLVPIVHQRVESASVADALRAPNWISFEDEAAFDSSLATLVRTLEIDLAWLDAHARYTVLAGDWVRRNRDPSLLLRGDDLRAAETWLAEAASHDEAATETQVGFILASRRAAARRRRLLFVAVLAALAVSIGLAVFAFSQYRHAVHERNAAETAQTRAENARKQAETARKKAEAGELAAESRAEPDPAKSLALAREAVGKEEDAGIEATAQPVAALRAALDRSLLRTRLRVPTRAGAVEDAAFSADGRFVATANSDDSVSLFDATGKTMRSVLPPRALREKLEGLTFSPHGGLLLAWGSARAWEWHVPSLRTVRGWPRAIRKPPGGPAIVFSDSGDRFLIALGSRRTRLVDGARAPTDLDVGCKVFAIDLSRRGDVALVACDNGKAFVWDRPRPGTKPAVIRTGRLAAVDLSPDGRYVVGARDPRRLSGKKRKLASEAVVWSTQTGKRKGVLAGGWGPTTRVSTAAFAGTSSSIVTSAGPSVRLWTLGPTEDRVTDGFSLTKPTCVSAVDQIVFAAGILRDTKTRQTLTGTGARCGRFSPDGSLFVTTKTRKPAIFDTGALAVVTLPGLHATSAAFRPDGRFVAAATDNGVQIWSVSGRRFSSHALPRLGFDAEEVAFDPSGKLLFVGGERGAWLWRPWSSSPPKRLPLPPGKTVDAWSAQSSPAGTMLATAAEGDDVRFWRVRGSTAAPAGTLRGPVQALAFSPDGRYLATVGAAGEDGKLPLVTVWDLARNRVVDQLPAPGTRARVSFAPGTAVLAIAAARKIVRRDWRRHRTLEPVTTDRGTVLDAAFSADGRMLAAGISTVDRGGTQVWDVGRREVAAWMTRPQMAAVAGVEFGRGGADEGGALLLAVSRNNRIRLFRCDACLPLAKLLKLADSRIEAAS